MLVLIASVGFLAAASNSILAVAKIEDTENVVDDFEDFSETTAAKLESSADSGVSMSNYPLPLKLFTFWFRPLFIDSPGVLGLFSSAENLIYLLLFAKICNRRFLRFIVKAPYMVKMSAIVFIVLICTNFCYVEFGNYNETKISGDVFWIFVIYYFLAQEKWQKMQREKERNSSLSVVV